jgi:predicted TIM-barrel fold metal-dependent hydrolase
VAGIADGQAAAGQLNQPGLPLLTRGPAPVYRGGMSAVDFHVHAFPDELAPRAVSRIEGLSGITSVLDGSLQSLLASMDAAGIEQSVILSIATKPAQFSSILAWSRKIASKRIIPFLSVSPSHPQSRENVRIAAEEGFRGLKFHPYYQDFDLDDPAMDPVYAAMEERGLICVSHTGFDHAFPFVRRADPSRILRVLKKFPRLAFVATHLGAWQDWELAERELPGANLWIDTSYSLEFMPREDARRLILCFPPDRVLFGTDSPWAGQVRSLALLRALCLGASREEAILSGNARAPPGQAQGRGGDAHVNDQPFSPSHNRRISAEDSRSSSSFPTASI